jgi:hypothetical protein
MPCLTPSTEPVRGGVRRRGGPFDWDSYEAELGHIGSEAELFLPASSGGVGLVDFDWSRYEAELDGVSQGFNIVLLGTASSGKSTFLAALGIALASAATNGPTGSVEFSHRELLLP